MRLRHLNSLTASTVVCLLVAGIARGQTTRRRTAPVPADAASPESILGAFYASVSHAPGAAPDFERMRGIFLYVGMIIPPKKPGEDIKVSDVDSYAEHYQQSIDLQKDKGQAPGFFQREIARHMDCFGNVCQVFSTYESRHAASDAAAFERGINSIQLIRDGSRWWIASVIWDVEQPKMGIPAEYLPAARPPA